MYGFFGLLPTSGDNFKSTAPLKICLLRKMVMCSILILTCVCVCVYVLGLSIDYNSHDCHELIRD